MIGLWFLDRSNWRREKKLWKEVHLAKIHSFFSLITSNNVIIFISVPIKFLSAFLMNIAFKSFIWMCLTVKLAAHFRRKNHVQCHKLTVFPHWKWSTTTRVGWAKITRAPTDCSSEVGSSTRKLTLLEMRLCTQREREILKVVSKWRKATKINEMEFKCKRSLCYFNERDYEKVF